MPVFHDNRAKWIESYEQAHCQLDRLQAQLAAIVFLLKSSESDDILEFDPTVREGLRIILGGISAELAQSFYERLPLPDKFAELCNGGAK